MQPDQKPKKKPALFGHVAEAADATFTQFGATEPVRSPVVEGKSGDGVVRDLTPQLPVSQAAAAKRAAIKTSRLEDLVERRRPLVKKITLDLDMEVYDELRAFHLQLQNKGLEISMRKLIQTAICDFVEGHSDASE